ncbi:nucleotide-diphosphate-sugar epimerase [Reticulibacter mediterranei]|uniref:Nucleotide-diphosphate-sugar epimerase n=1 Tax=Reticulibacter mediterranei TaxID=2778369 RepID=A0A8J3IV19_9CHLR|nr:NAD(P)H-binding protein [Reticulibacter mediterranei]GHO99005.1 nucleotide-diphosphate-sugar epimerase [Reticulibacter mediterranei]
MILVTGATGNVGEELVRALDNAGHRVRALVRAPKAGSLPTSVEKVTGDLNQPETLSSALIGVQGVFLLSGYQDMDGLLAQMSHAGVEQVVLLSGSSAPTGDMSNAITRYMVRSEIAVRESGIPWTILQPNSFMSNALRWVPQIRAGNLVRTAFPGVRVATIDPFDIAQVAATVFASAEHEGKSYRLSGPESLLPAEQVAILGRVLGQALQFEGIPDDQARVEMSATMPMEYVEAFFSFFAEGKLDESHVLPTVANLTGRRPHTFEQWAVAHATAFR